MIRNELLEERLVQPLPGTLQADFAYFLVYPPGALDRQASAVFRSWLLDQVGSCSVSLALGAHRQAMRRCPAKIGVTLPCVSLAAGMSFQ